MNGPHDVGGRAGFGAVVPEPEGPPFHAAGEARALGLTLAAAALGHWTLDGMRHARESLAPATYYAAGYYGIWIRALEAKLIAAGEVTAEELAAGRAQTPGRRPDRRLPAAAVPGVLARGAPVDRPASRPPRFASGCAVRTRNHQPVTHTRLPAYAREKTGTVEAVVGHHVLPDANAHGRGEAAEWLYTVAFDGRTLWGADGDPGLIVSIDAWESYLDPA